jgi:hypothetical protein
VKYRLADSAAPRTPQGQGQAEFGTRVASEPLNSRMCCGVNVKAWGRCNTLEKQAPHWHDWLSAVPCSPQVSEPPPHLNRPPQLHPL